MSESTPKAAKLAFRDVQIGQIFEIERSFTAEDVLRFAAVSGSESAFLTGANVPVSGGLVMP